MRLQDKSNHRSLQAKKFSQPKKQRHPWSFAFSDRRIAATGSDGYEVKRGTVRGNVGKQDADELMVLAEYAIRDRPRALKHARRVYREACSPLDLSIARSRR